MLPFMGGMRAFFAFQHQETGLHLKSGGLYGYLRYQISSDWKVPVTVGDLMVVASAPRCGWYG